MALLEVQNLEVSYGVIRAIKGISFEGNEGGGALEDYCPGEEYGGYCVAVDALFGIGLNSPLRSDALAAVGEMEKARWRVAADIPSGLHADTGAVLGAAVAADITVTFSAPKPGLLTEEGRRYAGKVVVADIGIPRELLV